MPVWTAPTTVAAAGALALLLAYATVLPPGPTAAASIVPTAALPVARTTAHRSGPPTVPRAPLTTAAAYPAGTAPEAPRTGGGLPLVRLEGRQPAAWPLALWGAASFTAAFALRRWTGAAARRRASTLLPLPAGTGAPMAMAAAAAVTPEPAAPGPVDGTSVPMSGSAPARPPQPHVAVVGAGWGGWAACKALLANGCRVTLFDSAPDPTGGTAPRTPTGKPFDAGQRGFWKDYPNIEAMLGEVGVAEADVFTPFTTSQFFSPAGLEATAPVFSASTLPRLPSPLGQMAATLNNFTRLPLLDRATLAGLLYAMVDFDRDEATFERYDRMTAHELFLRIGMSKRLVDDFVRPTLLVGLFKAPEELSAAVALELLYFYALAHQDSFDVRWLRAGSVAETLIHPLASSLASSGSLTVEGGTYVEGLDLAPDGRRVTGVRYRRPGAPAPETLPVDACVLALGARGLRAVVGNSPAVARQCPELAATAALNGIDVIACRLWLDRRVPTDAPANVFANFEGLRGAGGTFFMLDQLQPDLQALWGDKEPKGSVVACDFYNSSALACLSDADIVDLLMRELLPAAVPAFRAATVLDSCVQRYPGAVTWFSPGSFRKRPPLQTSLPNLVCAGDLVRLGEREHGAKGLCQERAYVSGLEAANALARAGALGPRTRQHPVLPVRKDEPQVVAGRRLNKRAMDLLRPLGLDSPWVR